MTTALASLPIDRDRLTTRFQDLKAAGQSALMAFITAGDPDLETSAKILAGLPKAGADIIELSVPFSDPMADGPIIQHANVRALKAGTSLVKVLALVKAFRTNDTKTPLILMGYFNPILVYGVKRFLKDALDAGVDGLIVVDCPPEEDQELCLPAREAGLHFIRLVTPTTDPKRLPTVLKNASGFLYYVSVAGITGTKAVSAEPVRHALEIIRRHSHLPIGVGFGISTPDQAALIAQEADGVIIGSAIVKRIADHLDAEGRATPGLVENVLGFVTQLANAVHKR